MPRTKQSVVRTSEKRPSTAFKSPIKKKTVKRHKRHRPGQLALLEIRKYQSTYNPLIPFAPFQRVAREIASKTSGDFRWQLSALLALREATEAYMVRFFEDAQLCAIHGNRQTIMVKDFNLLRRLYNRAEGGYN